MCRKAFVRIEPGVYAIGNDSGGIACVTLVPEAVNGDRAGREFGEYGEEVAVARVEIQLWNYGAFRAELPVPFLGVWPRRRLELVAD